MSNQRQRRDCTHQRVHHEHGTRAAYVADHCHCDSCTQANRAASRTRRRALTYGTWSPYRSGTAAARHIYRLVDAGMSITDIADTAHLSRSTVTRLYSTQFPGRIRVTTHTAVLSVKAPPRPNARRFSVPTRHRTSTGRTDR